MADQPLTARGAATRDRILEVATREFAEHGIAGARIERIVAAARTNKAQLYAYFGSKEGLFDAIFFGFAGADHERRPDRRRPTSRTGRCASTTSTSAAPTSSGWPPGPAWSGARPATWSPTPTASTTTSCAPSPRPRPPAPCVRGRPVRRHGMVIAMSMAWSPVSNVYAATAEEPAELHDRRRALLRETVRRAVTTG